MKTIVRNLSIIGVIAFMFACKSEEPSPEPTGSFNFSAPNSDLRAPTEISFTASDEIEGATFMWDFGDNTTSTDKTPKKIYTTGGTKIVKLTVTANSKSKTETKTISIDSPYAKVRIVKSTILGAATAYPNGTGWDVSSTGGDYLQGGADVYLIARFDGATVDAYYTSIKTNVTATQLTNGSQFWEHTSGFLVSSNVAASSNLRIYLRDADVNANLWTSTYESMGYIDLKLSDLIQIGNKYPTSVELKGVSGSTITGNQKYLNDALKIKLDLKWEE